MGDTMRKYIYSFLIYCVLALGFLPIALNENKKDIEQVGKVITIENNLVSYEPINGELAINEEEQEKFNDYVLGEKTSLEEYIIGVVAAEMPALFNMEALRAQSVAARTYAVNQMQANDIDIKDMISSGGQAYNSLDDMKLKWGESYNTYYKKIETAVLSTAGEVMVYNDEPILAVFHAISRGQTETAQNIWNSELPYLKSVESKADEQAPEFSYELSIPITTVAALLQKEEPSLKLYDGNLKEQMQVVEKTEAGYIKTIQIGNILFTGKQVREALGLRSTDFIAKQEGDNMIFTTKGYGHGAGMSQYGANFMALEGSDYKEILNYYYADIEFEKMN